jgi:hypothetical protein
MHAPFIQHRADLCVDRRGRVDDTKCVGPAGRAVMTLTPRQLSASTSRPSKYVRATTRLSTSLTWPAPTVQEHPLPSLGPWRAVQHPVRLPLRSRPRALTRRGTRPYWRCYFPNTAAIIYVIDASDGARLPTSRSELLTMLSEDELAGVPLLVFANKQDVPGALAPDAVSDALGLAGGERNREWSVRGSCATKGEGLEEGLDW